MLAVKPPYWKRIDHSHPLVKGLVGYWPFNEGTGNEIHDLSKPSVSGNDGVIHGELWASGKEGLALDFNGASDYITVPNSPELNPSHITIVSRAMRSSGTTGINFIDKPYTNHANPYYQYALQHYQGGAALNVTVDGTIKYVDSIKTPMPLGESHVLAGTYDGQTLRMYKDGVETDSLAAAGSISSYATDLKIGRVANVGSYFPGQIDYVFIYNRALSAEEIAWLYRQPYAIFH